VTWTVLLGFQDVTRGHSNNKTTNRYCEQPNKHVHTTA